MQAVERSNNAFEHVAICSFERRRRAFASSSHHTNEITFNAIDGKTVSNDTKRKAQNLKKKHWNVTSMR